MFSIHSTSSSRELVFSNHNRERFRAELKGDVTAAINVWTYTDENSLLALFQDIGSRVKPWNGEKTWSSIEGEFSLSASCSSLGDVLFRVDFRGLAGSPEEWQVSAGLETELGQLCSIAAIAEDFFSG